MDGLVAGLVIAWFSLPGKRFIGFSRESYDETRRVPTSRASTASSPPTPTCARS